MFWKATFFFIEVFFEFVNILQRTTELFKTAIGRNRHLEKNKIMKDEKADQKIFIVGNGPSVKAQNIQDLECENSVFVNMGFLHPLYQKILPEYHVIVDPKLANGEWDIAILDEIISLNPEVKLVLNGKWFHLEKFQPYINNKKINIIWMKNSLFLTRFHNFNRCGISQITYGMGVLGAALALVNHLGCKTVVLLGVESNAFCKEFEAKESHFYGLNKDNINLSSEQIYKSLFFNYLYLLGLHNLEKKSKRLSVINCTPGGILKMFQRDELTNQIGKAEVARDAN